MENNNQSSISRIRQQLTVFENYLAALKQMTVGLVQHDLLGLEQSLELEAQLVAQMAAFKEAPSSSSQRADTTETPLEKTIRNHAEQEINGFRNERLTLLRSLKRVAQEIQAASALNSILIDNGRRFSQTLLSTIYPPSTYRPLISHQPPIGAEVSVQPLISVQS